MLEHEFEMERKINSCYICCQEICGEDSDHQKITFEEFTLLMEQKAGFIPQIAKLKSKIRRAFLKIENYSKINLNFEIQKLNLLVDKLHFWYLLSTLSSLKDVQAAIYGFMLSKAQNIRLILSLNNVDRRDLRFPAYDDMFKQVHYFKKNIRSFIDHGDQNYLMRKFIEIIERQEKKQRELNMIRIQNYRPGEPNNFQQIGIPQYVLIYGLPFNSERCTLDLSTLKVDDKILVQILPSLQKMKKLKEFHLRNSKLSRKGYKILLNVLPDLEALDLSNSNSDNFLDLIPPKFPNLKSLYLNQACIDKQEKLQILMNFFPNLKVLFLNNNKISTPMVRSLVNKKFGLMYVSMKDNTIDWNEGQNLIVQFLKKGGYFEF